MTYRAKTVHGAMRVFRASLGHLGKEVWRALPWTTSWVQPRAQLLATGNVRDLLKDEPGVDAYRPHDWECAVTVWWQNPGAYRYMPAPPPCSCGRNR